MSKLVCKLKIDKNTCYSCLDDQISSNKYIACEKCELKKREYEILSMGHSLFKGDWAMVLRPDGAIERVSLDRVYDVRHIM